MRRLALCAALLASACNSKTAQPDPALPEPPCGTRDGMVGIKRLDTGACFWMDARPVSRREFLDAVEAGMPFAMDGACAGHAEHAPQFRVSRTDWCKGRDNLFDIYGSQLDLQGVPHYLKWPPGGNTGHAPMNCASWCDAKAYCDFVGKRMCRGADVGRLSEATVGADEVSAACAVRGEPKGNAEGRTCACWYTQPDECRRNDGWDCTLTQCEGPYAGMHCMMGNHLFVESNEPAMQSMGWDMSALNCAEGSVAVARGSQSDRDSANIVCCTD